MSFRVRRGQLEVEVDTFDELRQVLAELDAALQADPVPATVSGSASPALLEALPRHMESDADHHETEPAVVKLKFASSDDAFHRFTRDLKRKAPANVFAGVKFLLSRGNEGASQDEIRKAINAPPNYRMNGFTAVLTRRPRGYGIDPDDVLVVRSPGIIAQTRVYVYRLGARYQDFLRRFPASLADD